MKTRILTITLAAVLGLVGVVAVLAYVHQANERAVNGLKAETVVVAKGTIPAGTSLYKAQQDDLLGTEKVPVSSLSAGGVPSVNNANRHLVTTANMAKGQPLFQNMLASASTVNKQSGASLAVPKGMVAVTVNMCIDEAVGSYATPGSDVAVFDTVVDTQWSRTCDAQHPALSLAQLRNGASTLLVLPSVEVLALGSNPSAPSTSGGSSSVTVNNDPSSSTSTEEVLVTVAVNQADAEQLILMEEVGLPYMALIGPGTTLTPSQQDPLLHQQLQK